MKPEPFVVSPETRAAPLQVLGVDVTVLAANERTRGYEITLQAGAEGVGPPPHRHDWDESFFVLRGSVEIQIAGEAHLCTPGMLVHLPAGTVHGYRFGAGGGEMFEITGAGGNATRMFSEVDRKVRPGPPDVPMLTALLERNGVALVLA
ncbi:MAG: cupin domain-containing protein [Burkholderiaceae bacterium]|nr:cupin domain-containing protein [Burkholderiaceae bacterium]